MTGLNGHENVVTRTRSLSKEQRRVFYVISVLRLVWGRMAFSRRITFGAKGFGIVSQPGLVMLGTG